MKNKPTIEDFLSVSNKIVCDVPVSWFHESRDLAEYFETELNLDLNLAELHEVKCDLEIEKHRWYEISTTVFEIDGRYLGVTGVSTVYNEVADFKDMNVDFEFTEYEEVKAVTYKPKNK